ncbi:atypical chemokine receptor 3-like [Poecilia reticulata]|uniref:atypical chemokine receptor 3-like n=1 Tax=Poecilia reticulata TaxID=8081 RepID=UPI0004A4CC63|nr:PREDICTED: atypical chemokine receptor 3-like [Poecilia reticulata]
MSLSSSDLSELVDLWEELNLTSNLSRVEAMMCSGAVSHAALLLCLSILYIFIFLVGVASNILVFWVNLRPDRAQCGSHLYVVNLAVADLGVVLTLPVWVTSLLQGGLWPFGEVICKVTHLVFSLNLFSSIFFLACMSVDSYLSATLLSGALSWRRKTLRRLICASLWLLALAASVPDTYFLQAVRSPHRDGAVCRPVYPPENPRDWMVGVQLSFFVLGFAVPFPIIAVFYLLLVAAIPPSSDPERRISRRIVLSYILVFLVCWLPFHAVLLLDSLTLMNVLPFTCRLESFLDVALHLTQCFSLVHCCVNPILYNLWHRSYRDDLMKAFIFRYSSRTGLARLIDTSQASETENSAVLVDHSGPI